MSGGIAYVYDPKARFRDLCNMAMVELEPVLGPVGPAGGDKDGAGRPHQRASSAEDSGMGGGLAFDRGRLRGRVERPHPPSARALLEDWDNALKSFIKVVPKDYKRALVQARERAAAKAVAAE